MAYIGLDIGTSGCKAAVYNADGVRIAESGASYPIHAPRPGVAELDANEILDAVLRVLADIAPRCDGSDALAISGIGESFVLTDEAGRPLNRFVTYLDDRGERELEEIRAECPDEELFRLSGVHANRTYALTRLRWLSRHEPELLKSATAIMFYNEYFAYRLTGCRAVDPGTAVRSQLVCAGGSAWNETLLSLARVDPDKLAPIRATGEYLGTILPDIAERTGLPCSLRVLVGCHDQCAAVLGAGAWETGDAILGEGSSESINVIVESAQAAPTRALYESEVVAEPFLNGRSLLIAAQSAFCTNLQWFMRNFARGQDADGMCFDDWDARCPADTELIFVPYLSTMNVMDSDAVVNGAVLGLRFSSTPEDIYRAVLEGMHMESLRNLRRMEALGVRFKRLIANGGNSRSALSMQIKADVYERPVETLEQPDAGVTGLAMICAVSEGAMDYAEAVRRFTRVGQVFRPGRDYREKFARYLNYTENLRTAERIWNERRLEK